MKTDALTLAAVIFVVSLLVSGLGVTEVFDEDAVAPPSALQQGVTIR